LISLKQTARTKLQDTCTVTQIDLRRATNIEPIWKRLEDNLLADSTIILVSGKITSASY
jgi:hypothetical protein